MNVVNYSEAARIAGVSRQMITKIKNAHKEGKSKKPYFKHDPYTGKPGIDIDDKAWINYVNKNCKHRGHKNELSNTTFLQPNSIENIKNEVVNTMVKSVYTVLMRDTEYRGKKLKAICENIGKDFEREYERG